MPLEQDGKTDVKSLMAKFNTGSNPTEEVSTGSRPFKVAGQNLPSGIQSRKNLFDNQGNASPPAGPSNMPKFGTTKPPLAAKPTYEDKPEKEPKPPFLKPTGVSPRFGAQPNSVSRDPEVKVGFLKPVSPKPTSLTKEDSKPVVLRPPGNKLHNLNQESDIRTPGPKPGPAPPVPENDLKPGFSKVAGAKSKFMPAAQDADSKPRFPRHTFGQKPSLSTEDSQEEENTSNNVPVQKGSPVQLGTKSKGGPFKPAKEDSEDKDQGTPSSPFAGVVLKPAASRGSLGLSKNSEEKKEDRKTDTTKNIFLNKLNQEESARFPKAPSKLTAGTPWGQSQEKEGDKNSATPKQKPLPPLSVLGPPPPKPSRPPNVDLTRFRKAESANSTNKNQTPYSTTSLPPPPPTNPASQPPLPASHPSHPPVPSLPPRNIKPPLDLKHPINEENQDGVMHSDGTGNLEEEQESEGETYEDIESSKERDKKREKEEKKRLELERKEQKEREKKEQELKKKFKLMGPIQVLHHAKACCDVKGGKNELSFKQGEDIEIIRITDNPEGKWLGRTARGSYGYIKTTAVEIDYDSLKRKKNSFNAVPPRLVEDDQEVYDDVAEQDASNSHGQSGSGGMFPPPPTDEEIYDGIEEENVDDGFPSPNKQLDMGEEVYDDVDASDFPPPPAELSQGMSIGKAKTEDKDPKKLKKQEKEEKDLRKKFKYDGEIRVLYSTKVASSLTSKKWGARDLQIKPGESLEVIQSTDDTKVLCRNEEGKYGYVLRSYLVDNDGEIYDDIADGCIYDND
ncbi:FYN-binding protein 1 isoform X5 [Grammomys surdaster]|uniref:FYN-binding protein 1 isoform X5 n=1 Tax=Grammomys surdaster TaxID=491861 RepID=UPI00109FC0FF|nr:FYN-binding protein 1 isoform X5 [Grammomys surdaster]